jgi:hypothetical protein
MGGTSVPSLSDLPACLSQQVLSKIQLSVFEVRRSIIVVPIMPPVMSTVMAAVIVTTIVGGAIVNASMVVIISVPGITVAAVVIAGPVIILRCTESDAEALCLRLIWGHSQQS